MNKKILLMGLIIIVVTMSIGYAIYSTSLKVTGTGNIDSNFNIEVTGIKEDKKEGKAISITEPTYTKTSATFNTKLSREKDNIEYKVEISNKGSIDGKIEKIEIINPNEQVLVETRGIEKGQILKAGEKLEYIVRVCIPEGTKINEDVTSKIEINTEIIQDDNQIFNEPEDGIEANKLSIESTIEESDYTSIKATIKAKGDGLKYSYSLDDKEYTEATESNTHIFTGLIPNKRYTVYYKVEDKDGNYETESKWITTQDITNSIIKVENENNWTRSKKVTIEYPEIEGSKYYYKIGSNEYIEATNPKEINVEENTSIYAKIENEGNITEITKEVIKIDNKAPELTINTSTTTKSITVIGNAIDESGVEKYEYSINDEDYIDNGKYNNYTFDGLVHNTEYKIKVRVTDKVGNQTEKEEVVKTIKIEMPTFQIDKLEYADSKTLTINYNNDNLVKEYSFDGSTWEEAKTIQTLDFITEGSVIARVTDGVNYVTSNVYNVIKIDESLLGEIIIYAGNKELENYLPCDGRAISREEYSELFEIIGTTYGSGNGSTTFNLPNITDRKVIGSSNAVPLGTTGGSNTSKLTSMPAHTHNIPVLSGTAASAGAHQHNIDSASANAGTITLAINSNSVSNIWTKYSDKKGFAKSSSGWYGDWGQGRVNKVASAGAHNHSVTTVANTSGSTGSGIEFNVENPYIKMKYYIKVKNNNLNNAYNLGTKSTRTGKIIVWSSNNIPEGYLVGNGQSVSREESSELFEEIGTTYGVGDRNTTFNLPNTLNRTLKGGTVGNVGGSTTVTLTNSNIPSHTHSIPSLSGTAASAGAHQHNIDSANVNAYAISMASNSDNVSNLIISVSKKSYFANYVTTSGMYRDWGKGRVTKVASAGAHTHNIATNENTTGGAGSGSSINIQNPYITEKYLIKNQGSSGISPGTIKIWSSNSVPDGYLLCDGRAISRETYSKLFEKIGTTYGSGDGSTTFNLPNMQGKQINGNNSSDVNGIVGGSNTVNVALSNIPNHTHKVPKLSGTAASAGAHQHNVDSVNANAATWTFNKNSNSVSNRWEVYTANRAFSMALENSNYSEWGKGIVYKVASSGAHPHNITTVAKASGSTGNPSVSISVQNSFIALNYIVKH